MYMVYIEFKIPTVFFSCGVTLLHFDYVFTVYSDYQVFLFLLIVAGGLGGI